MHIRSHHRDRLAGAGLVVLGAAALGWISRMPGGALAAAESSVATPLIVLGVCVVLAPALYIGLSLAGATTDTRRFAGAVTSAWRASGLVAVGLAPPLLFLVATTASEGVALALGALALTASLFVGLMALARNAGELTGAGYLCFGLWSCSAFAVGGRLFLKTVMP